MRSVVKKGEKGRGEKGLIIPLDVIASQKNNVIDL